MMQQSVPKDWWVEDLCELDMEFYKRIIIAIKSKGEAPDEVVGESLKAYACRRLPVFSKSVAHRGDFGKCQSLLETIVWLFPPKSGLVSCSFLLSLLKAARFLDCGENCKEELIKRIGYQLQDASVADLLIPAPVGESSLYDIDIILSMMEEFLMQEQSNTRCNSLTSKELQESTSPASDSSSSKVAVVNLVDGYLTEVAKNPNLPLPKFIELAEMESGSSRLSHNQLYRAIDIFLKLRESRQQIFLWRNCKLEETKFVNIHMFRNSAWYATTLGQASGIICDKPFGRYATTLGPCEGIPDAEQLAMQISFTVKLF